MSDRMRMECNGEDLQLDLEIETISCPGCGAAIAWPFSDEDAKALIAHSSHADILYGVRCVTPGEFFDQRFTMQINPKRPSA